MSDLDIFKAYCVLEGIGYKYAVCKIIDEKPQLHLLDGTISEHMAWGGRYVVNDVLYRLSLATCGGSCQIGKPKKGYPYSVNKCAVYFTEPEDLSHTNIHLTIKQFKEFKLDHKALSDIINLNGDDYSDGEILDMIVDKFKIKT